MVAYQFGPAAVGPQGESRSRKHCLPRSEIPQPVDRAIQPDIQTARSTLENLRKTYSQGTEGLVIDAAQYNNWSLNLLFNEMLADPSDDGRTKAMQGHRDRLAGLLKELSRQGERGKVPKSVITALEGHVQRAEIMLALQAQGGRLMGMMAGRMAGRGMNAGGMQGAAA